MNRENFKFLLGSIIKYKIIKIDWLKIGVQSAKSNSFLGTKKKKKNEKSK